MVLLVPEVSRCCVNSEGDVLSLFKSPSINQKTKNNLSQLSHVLQLSLDTDKVLQTFFKHVKQGLKLTKLLYVNKSHDINYLLGSKINNSQTKNKYLKKFELFYQDNFLGEIHVASKHKFTPSYVLELRTYINHLILPLNNALLYSQAVKATKTDGLTGLSNKLSLIEDLNYHFNLSKRFNSPLSVIFIDLDHFKKINDTYGHIVGDKILAHLAKLLKGNIRKSDIAYRYGGEEFVIILENTNQKGALNLAKKLNNIVKKQQIHVSNQVESIKFNITISLGIATKSSKDSPESLMHRADQALYTAKEQGRDKFVFE